jgi:nitrogen fixation NifU-like protein
MTESVKGKSVADATALFERFQHMITGQPDSGPPEPLGKLAAFAGVRDFPIRVKCASLAWHTLRAALDAREEAVSTE